MSRTDVIRVIAVFSCLFGVFGGFSWLGETWPNSNVLTKDMTINLFGLSLLWTAWALDKKKDKD